MPSRVVEAMKGAMWFTTVLEVVIMEVFLYWCDRTRDPVVSVATGKEEISARFDMNCNSFVPVSVYRVEMLNDTVMRIVFQCTSDVSSNTTPGQHIALRAETKQNAIIRNYTPVTTYSDMQAGRIDLIVRLVPNGVMSTILQNVERSPSVKFSISLCHGSFGYTANKVSALIFVGSGTGITPLINIARAVLTNPNDQTRVKLVFKVRDEKDVFIEEEIRGLERVALESTQFLVSDVVGQFAIDSRFEFEIVWEKGTAEQLVEKWL